MFCYIFTAGSDLQSNRRSSMRSIKRKKFDDELVESSLSKAEKPRVKVAVEPKISESSTSAASLAGVSEIRKREKAVIKNMFKLY